MYRSSHVSHHLQLRAEDYAAAFTALSLLLMTTSAFWLKEMFGSYLYRLYTISNTINYLCWFKKYFLSQGCQPCEAKNREIPWSKNSEK